MCGRLAGMAEHVRVPIEVYEKLTPAERTAMLKEQIITDPAEVTPSMRASAAEGMRILSERSTQSRAVWRPRSRR